MNKKMVDIHLTEDTLHAVSRAVGYGDAILAIAGMIRKGAPLFAPGARAALLSLADTIENNVQEMMHEYLSAINDSQRQKDRACH